MSEIRKLHDVQKEILDLIPSEMNGIKSLINNSRWDDAEKIITDEIRYFWYKRQNLVRAKRIIKRIRQ